MGISAQPHNSTMAWGLFFSYSFLRLSTIGGFLGSKLAFCVLLLSLYKVFLLYTDGGIFCSHLGLHSWLCIARSCFSLRRWLRISLWQVRRGGRGGHLLSNFRLLVGRIVGCSGVNICIFHLYICGVSSRLR